MKLKDPFEGNCKHGIPKKQACDKCFAKMAKDYSKTTERFLKDLAKAEKKGRNCKLQFD